MVEIGKQRLNQNAGIVAGKATGRASAGKSASIQINPDRGKLNTKIGSDHTKLKDQKDLEPKRDQTL